MKKYRKIKKSDKFPELPKGIKPRFILRQKNWTYIFAEDEEKRYTFQWDRVSEYFNYVFQNYKQGEYLVPLDVREYLFSISHLDKENE